MMNTSRNVIAYFELLLFIVVHVFSFIEAFCPNGCQCDDVGLKVYCLAAKLDVVPILLNPGTKHLDLSHNEILSILPGFAFYHVLDHLDLSHNKIDSLGTKNFASLNNLAELVASNNKITAIHGRTFDGLGSLGDLNLRENDINSIDDGAFQALKSLKKLDLSGNKLKFLGSEIFFNLEGLKVLNLCKNELGNISKVSFVHLKGLQELRICSNRLTVLDNRVFSNQRDLLYLFLEQNKIYKLGENVFKGLNSLKLLDMHKNLLKDIPSKELSRLPRLEELVLGENLYKVLRDDAFSKLTLLRSLYISNNKNLDRLSSGAFTNLTSLQYLEISRNEKLESISHRTLNPLSNLRHLILRGNSLRVLSESMFNTFELQTLDLRENHLECNCSLNWLNKLLRNGNSSLRIEDVECYSPEDLRGQRVSALTEYDLKCFSPFLLIVSSVSAITAFILMVIIVFYLYLKRCKKMKALVQDTWPEKIVTTWRDADITKKLETDDFIFGTSKNVSHIKIPEVFYSSRPPTSQNELFEPNYTYEQIKKDPHEQNGYTNNRLAADKTDFQYASRESTTHNTSTLDQKRQSYQSTPSTLCSPQSIYAEPIYHISTVEGVLPQHQRSKDSGFYSCEFLDQSSRHGSKTLYKNGASRQSNFSLCRPSKSYERDGVMTLNHLYAPPKHPNFGYSNDTIYDNII